MLSDISNKLEPSSKNDLSQFQSGSKRQLNKLNKPIAHPYRNSHFLNNNYHRNSKHSNNYGQLQSKPSYKFNKLFNTADEAMHPFLDISKLERDSNDGIDFTGKSNSYNDNSNIFKFTECLKTEYSTATITATTQSRFAIPWNKSANVDPINKLLTQEDNSIKFGDSIITIHANGSYSKTTKQIQTETKQPDTPLSSKRTADQIETTPFFANRLLSETASSSIASSSTSSSIISTPSIASSNQFSTPSPSLTTSLRKLTHFSSSISLLKSSAKKRKMPGTNTTTTNSNGPIPKHHKSSKYDKLDNSMTISQRGILKMVDDSLVSSDTEYYNSISLINVQNNNSQHFETTPVMKNKIIEQQQLTNKSLDNASNIENTKATKSQNNLLIKSNDNLPLDANEGCKDGDSININQEDLNNALLDINDGDYIFGTSTDFELKTTKKIKSLRD